MVDTMFENVDLLSLVESNFEEQNIIDAIYESEMAITLYETQRFLVEQDTHIFMELNYGIILESVINKLWDIAKNIFNRILEMLKKFKNFLIGKKSKIEQTKKDIDWYHTNPEEILKEAAKNDDIKLRIIDIPDEIITFVENYKPLNTYKMINTISKAIDEFIDFSSKNNDNITPEQFAKECPNFILLFNMCNNDINILESKVYDELKIPKDKDIFIGSDDTVTAKEFLNKYYKNAKKMDSIITKIDRSKDDDDSKFQSKVFEQLHKLLKLRTDVKYREMASFFSKLNQCMLKVLHKRTDLYHTAINVPHLLSLNILHCQNILSSKKE